MTLNAGVLSIGKDAARNRLAKELVEEVLAECTICEQGADYHLHTPASDCVECKAPHEHHNYSPRGR
jgi:hypothetical protein